MSKKIEIVKYERKYRKMVRDCVYETGYGGKSAKIYFEDRALFADMITLYYTDYEPESGFVPLVDGKPGGYLLGAVDTEKYTTVMKKEIIPRMLKKMIIGKYNMGPGVRKNLYLSILSQMRGEGCEPPLDKYPAHLHIDLFSNFRRFGLGHKLIDAYLDYLRDLKIPGVHLGTSSFHTEALPFYEKLGFHQYSKKKMRTSLFEDISDKPFYNICYVMEL